MKQSRIAITGGIGSGKSAVAKIIKEEGYPVFSCDKIYEELLNEEGSLVQNIKDVFGDVFFADGSLNRKKLSKIVFADEKLRKKLNGITHPAIMERAKKMAEGLRLSFLEVPLLFENNFQSLFDGVIVVLRPLNDRISSVSQRDKISAEEVKNRIKNQFNYENFDFAKYYVIHNNLNLGDLKAKTLQIVGDIERKIN